MNSFILAFFVAASAFAQSIDSMIDRELPALLETYKAFHVAPEQIRIEVKREVAVSGHDEISLLIAWLNELIVLFDTEYLLFKEFEIDLITETNVQGRAAGEPYNARRHDLSSAIKAVTWHEAAVERTPEGYKARIIFDI